MPSLPVHRRSFLIASAALFAASSAAADPDPLDQVVAARAGLRTLRAVFTQERTLGLLASTITSHGELILVRPDRLRWRLEPPDEVTYWVTPTGLAFASRTSRGALDRDAAGVMGAVLTDLLVVLGGDIGSLRARYALSVERVEDGGLRISAEPRDPAVAKRVRRLRLELAPDLRSPREISFEESDTDHARIRFSDVRLNAVVDPALMQP